MHFWEKGRIIKRRKRLSTCDKRRTRSKKNGITERHCKKCGVSTATVSKALNDQKDIGESTKARIRETAKEMGYFPNSAARALKTKRSYSLGVLFEEEAGSGLKHEYFSSVLNGFKTQAESQGL